MNSDSPRVSIGLPVYNGAKYIEEALDSVLAQTFADFELIISDNASTDRTQEICQNYADKDNRIHYYCNNQNLGATQNYMRAFELSTGKYFKWAAHDDLIAPNYIEACVKVLEEYREVVLCYSKAIVIDDRGQFQEEHDPGPDLAGLGPHKRFREFLFTSYLSIQASGLIRADILKRTGGYGAYPASDEILLAELSLLGPFYEIPERLFSVRLHSEQSTFGALETGQDKIQFKQRDRIYWYFGDHNEIIVLPTWLYLLDGLRAIRWAPLKISERIYCYLQMVRWALNPHHFRALNKDLLLAVIKLVHIAFLKLGRSRHYFAGRE